MNRRSQIRSARTVAVCGSILVAWIATFGSSDAQACNVPVYRYAMNNWAPAPYWVFYFHRGQVAKEDEPVNRMLQELAEEDSVITNLAFLAIDVTKKKQLDRLDELIIKTWKSHGGQTPTHLVLTPWGADFFAGRLDPKTLQSMINSPMRTRIGELLKEGNAAVLLMLSCPREKLNAQAEKVVKELIDRVASGRLFGNPEFGPQGAPQPAIENLTPGGPANYLDQAPQATKLSLVKLSRTDPAEKWLVNLLTIVEPDLHEYAEEPMIFVVFGRGRALEPYIGKGITPDNLEECIMFLGGACSCMVKEQNPGVDLLFRWNWEATADALAEAYIAPGVGQLGYEEYVPGEDGGWVPASSQEPTGDVAAAPAATQSQAAARPAPPAAAANPPEQAESTTKAEKPDEPYGSAFAANQMWKFGVGFAVVAIFVLSAGFVLVRRR